MERIQDKFYMMEKRSQSLPDIHTVYETIRQNKDYNVVRAYQGGRTQHNAGKPTKKSTYLDDSLRSQCSPGPANTANQMKTWFRKGGFQSKRAERQTYLDEIVAKEKKWHGPSPSHYSVKQSWPDKKNEMKNISQKTNFADTCEYASDQIPGPGNYNIHGSILSKVEANKKYEPHKPLQPRAAIGAEVTSYTPCYVEYKTFDRYALLKATSQANLNKSFALTETKKKENKSPSPNTYSTISYWAGKSPNKQKERNFFKHLSKGPAVSVYH